MTKYLSYTALSHKSNILFITLFFSLLGSQLMVAHQWFFIFFSLFLIDWKRIISTETFVLGIFSLSMYGLVAYRNGEFFQNFDSMENNAKKILMLLVVYFLGLSAKGFSVNSLPDERKIFYLLYGFFIAYVLGILYSYLMLPQDNPLTTLGLHVFYENKWKYIRDGKLISTVIAYSLSLFVAILPLLLLNFKQFRERGFRLLELFILIGLVLFSLYLAIAMGRRLAILLLIIAFLYLIFKILLNKIKLKYFLVTLAGIFLLFLLSYTHLKDIGILKGTVFRGLSDSRFNYWIPGLQVMMDYPLGGGYHVNLEPTKWSKLAHNTWIDIGKNYGILAFVSSIIFYLLHMRYFIKIISNKEISDFIKNLIFIISIGLLLNMMIEPVFQSQRVYIYYSIFFLGFLKNYADFFDASRCSNSLIKE